VYWLVFFYDKFLQYTFSKFWISERKSFLNKFQKPTICPGYWERLFNIDCALKSFSEVILFKVTLNSSVSFNFLYIRFKKTLEYSLSQGFSVLDQGFHWDQRFHQSQQLYWMTWSKLRARGASSLWIRDGNV